LDGGTRTFAIKTTVTDDDGTADHTYTWSVIGLPAGATVEFNPNGTDVAANTDVTITVAEDYDIDVTDYVLQVEVNDNDEYTDTDTVTVKVYADGCQAAKNETATPYTETDARERGDTNWDCKVDFLDLAALALNWLFETVHVYENGCAAAKGNGYNLDKALLIGDTNYDCEVNLSDFATMASTWLNDEVNLADLTTMASNWLADVSK
jgi:hypothetical protein